MTLEEFSKLDKSFNETVFIANVNNMFIKFFTNIMLDTLPEVKHFVSDEVYEYGLSLIEEAKKRRCRQMYDELNVKNTIIQSIEQDDDYYVINVILHSRYMNYIISLDDGSYVSGNNTSREQVNYSLVLKKKRVTKQKDIVRKCPSCGASINVNASGKCKYCGTIFNQEDYDWIITSLNKLN